MAFELGERLAAAGTLSKKMTCSFVVKSWKNDETGRTILADLGVLAEEREPERGA